MHTYNYNVMDVMSTVLMLCPLVDHQYHHQPHTSTHWGDLYTGTLISSNRQLPSLDPAPAARLIMVDGCAPIVPSSNCQQSSIEG